MKSIGTYLTFDGKCAEAFAFYERVFKKKVCVQMTYGASPMKDKVPDDKKDLILHTGLDVGMGKCSLMGSDYVAEFCCTDNKLVVGTNSCINLVPDTKEETDRLFQAFAGQEGSKVICPIGNQFWGSYFGMVKDAFGVQWMFDFPLCDDEKKENED